MVLGILLSFTSSVMAYYYNEKEKQSFQRYTEITSDPLLFSVAQGIFWLSSERLSRSTLHLIEGGEGSLYSCTVLRSLATVMPFVRIVTKSPKVGGTSTYIFHLSESFQRAVSCTEYVIIVIAEKFPEVFFINCAKFWILGPFNLIFFFEASRLRRIHCFLRRIMLKFTRVGNYSAVPIAQSN